MVLYRMKFAKSLANQFLSPIKEKMKYREWKFQECNKLRLPYIESMIKDLERNRLDMNYRRFTSEYFIALRELWIIKNSIGSPMEKAKISPGMVHPYTLKWSRAAAVGMGISGKLRLDIYQYSLSRILWKKVKNVL